MEVLEDKEIPAEKLAGLLDSGFAKGVSLRAYTDEVLLLEVDGMTDMLYEKLEAAREMLAEGDSIEKVCRIQKLTEAQVRSL